MSEIHVTASGLWREETAECVIDRPYGLRQFLLVRFHSPMLILLAQGMVRAEPGHCVLFSPEYPQWYRGAEGSFINDWMHIEGFAVAHVAAKHEVPLDTLLVPADTRFLPRLFDEISYERYHNEAGWEDAVVLLVHQLLLKLGRALRDPAAHFTPAEAEHLPSLRNLRRRVHEQLTRRWTVGEMAAEVGLSASRFAALYQRFFGVSPLEDLLRARIQNAENLLTNRALPVGEAATQSGFSNLHYFSHVFHQRVGCAPRDYHRRGNPRPSNPRASNHKARHVLHGTD